MQLKALCLYLTALLTLFIASSVQASPVALARGDLVATSGGYIDDRGIPEGRQETGLEEAGAEGNKGWGARKRAVVAHDDTDPHWSGWGGK
ncbi:hypothetical protein EV363DRAFT_1434798 [Boletus edulis]|nr:hypothetical protein EV363DRAFT_1434798 [Boletus edulis]